MVKNVQKLQKITIIQWNSHIRENRKKYRSYPKINRCNRYPTLTTSSRGPIEAKNELIREFLVFTAVCGGENPALGTLDAHTWFITHLLLPFAFFKTKLCCFCLTIIRVCKRNSFKNSFWKWPKMCHFKYCESDLLDFVISILVDDDQHWLVSIVVISSSWINCRLPSRHFAFSTNHHLPLGYKIFISPNFNLKITVTHLRYCLFCGFLF